MYDNIKIDPEGDIIFLTMSRYKKLMSFGVVGMDAKNLYEHLMFTARLQGTMSVWAKDTYLMKGLHLGKDKLKKAKALLHKLKLIEYRQDRDEEGHFKDSYILIKTSYTTAPVDRVEPPPDSDNEPGGLIYRPPGHPDHPLQTTNSNTSKKKSIHGVLRDAFSKGFNVLHFPDIYYHDAKEAKQIDNIGNRAGGDLSVIRRKMELLYTGILKPKNDFWADLKFKPSTLISQWNNLTEARQTGLNRNKLFDMLGDIDV